MLSKLSSQKNEKSRGQNEGTIASRLRSSSKIEGKSSRLSKNGKEKGINKSLVGPTTPAQIIKTKKSSSSKPAQIIKTKDLSSFITPPSSKNQEQPIKKIKSSVVGPSSSNVDKGKEKVKPTHKPQDTKKSIVDIKPVYHIRWKGFENTIPRWTCSLCGKGLEEKEEEEHEIQLGENELQHILLSIQGREDQLSSVLPEVAVLPCTHGFPFQALPFFFFHKSIVCFACGVDSFISQPEVVTLPFVLPICSSYIETVLVLGDMLVGRIALSKVSGIALSVLRLASNGVS
ncbi:hypothetical protein TSUD_147120 [Trifolium subterraneum]|uniref:Uncharacterized protein n=1 Tax=Trifolium subterraneum TaxID=3900 RepID=A0A2Z6M7Q9_TRISU|nr:hypothetical protein TSUD_147120 [Trifolium subterraneum]